MVPVGLATALVTGETCIVLAVLGMLARPVTIIMFSTYCKIYANDLDSFC